MALYCDNVVYIVGVDQRRWGLHPGPAGLAVKVKDLVQEIVDCLKHC